MNKKAFTILELLIVILALIILLGVISRIFLTGSDIWSKGFSRSSIRSSLAQSIELLSNSLRRATSIDAITPSSITFTADLGSGSDTYRVYLYNALDAEPNPPYTQSVYDLRWVQGAVTYGLGANIATDIMAPINTPFIQNGNVITIDLSATKDDQTVRVRSKVRIRNL